MILSALDQEFVDRGFGYLPAARRTQYLNLAIREIEEQGHWSYRQATVTGTAPLTVGDLGEVETVFDGTQTRALRRTTRDELLQSWADLSTAGTPFWWYLTGGNVVNVYPVAAGDSITVRYWRVSADLVNPTDTPGLPGRVHYAIVDYAVGRALADRSNFQEAQAARAEGDRLLGLVGAALMDLPLAQVQTDLADR